MKKIKLDKKYMKIALYSFGVLAACILLSRFLDNIGSVFALTGSFFLKIKDILITFIYGFFIAFFFTPLVNFLEKFLKSRSKKLNSKPKLTRNLTILITYAIFIGCFVWLMVYMIPTVIKSFNALVVSLPRDLDELVNKLPEMLSFLDGETKQTVMGAITKITAPIHDKLTDLSGIMSEFITGDTVAGILNSTVSLVKMIINLLIGIIISFYMLSSKESIAASCKKFCLAVFENGRAERIISNMQRVNMIFQSFVLGKLLDAIVLGLMCFVGMIILRIPYALVISVIIGVTNMIPYVGPFIGTVPAVFIILLVDPVKALWFLVFILVIQQIDNYLICPRLLGDPTGLSPLQVLFAIAIGAYFGGAFGMFLGVPVVASVKLFFSEAVNRRFIEKYPHGSPGLDKDDDDDLFDDDDEDFAEDIPED